MSNNNATISSWKRPENVPFPSVWSRFKGKKEINGKVPTFWVQDIPENLFDTAVDVMLKSYIFEEPLCKYSKLYEDETSIQEFKALWRKLLEHKLGLICFMENVESDKEPLIAGVNITCVSVKGSTDNTVYHGKSWTTVRDSVLYVMCEMIDPFEVLKINEYMNGMGLTVLPKFRGQGVGEELLKARIPLCRAVGLKATLTLYSNISSQKIAEKIGFKDLLTISYEDLEKINPRYSFPGISEHTQNVRFMYLFV